MSEELSDNWDEITDIELEKRLQTEKIKREQEMNGMSILSNGSDFKPRILQRPKEAQPKVTILKRPESSSTSSSSNQLGSQKPPQKTLEQREKEYAEARRRILGSESENTEQTLNYSTKISPSSSSNCLPDYNFNPSIPPPRLPDNLLRNPRGPTPGNGFNIRR